MALFFGDCAVCRAGDGVGAASVPPDGAVGGNQVLVEIRMTVHRLLIIGFTAVSLTIWIVFGSKFA